MRMSMSFRIFDYEGLENMQKLTVIIFSFPGTLRAYEVTSIVFSD